MTTAIFPGTFDPITNGHLDIAQRASELFDDLIVAVYAHPIKTLLFSTSERLEMAEKAFEGWPNVTVRCYDGLTVDIAREWGARAIVRGLVRSITFPPVPAAAAPWSDSTSPDMTRLR